MMRNDTPERSHIVPLDVPKLSIRGPIAIGLLAVALFSAAGAFAAHTYMAPKVSRLTASLETDVIETIVRAPEAGQAVEFLVEPGELVAAGQKLAQLDNGVLDDQVARLASQAVAARWRLKTIRAMVAKARKSPGAGSMTVKSGLASLKAEIKNVEQIVRMLGWRLAQAEQEAVKFVIFARVAGRVELLVDRGADNLPGNRDGKERAILKLVNERGPVSVRAVVPAGLLQTAGLGTRARVILRDPHTHIHQAFPAHLKSTVRRVHAASGTEADYGEAIFEIAVPRSQIAKQIELQSPMKAEVLVETGRQRLFRQLFAFAL